MFEQSILAPPRGAARTATFAVSLGSQMLFIGTALILPLFFIEGPSVTRLNALLVAPPPPPPPPLMMKLVAVPNAIRRMFDGARLFAPVRIPTEVAKIVETDLPPLDGAPDIGVVGVRHAVGTPRRPRRAGRYIGISGAAARSFGSSGSSVIVASVNSSVLATDTAFSSAIRTTLVGSMIPASMRST